MALVTSVKPCPPAFQSGKYHRLMAIPPVDMTVVLLVTTPSSRAPAATTGLKVEPDGKEAEMARGNRGLSSSSRKAEYSSGDIPCEKRLAS